MSKPLPSKNYSQIAKQLKNLGAIDYDLRKELTPGQKSNITRKFHAMRDILKNPEDYAFKSVSNHVKKEARHLGFVSTKKFLIIEKGGYTDIKIETRKKKHGRKETTIVKSMPGKKEKTKLIHGERLLKVLEKVKNDLPKGQYITCRIGKNSHFKRRFKTGAELNKYLLTWNPREGGDKQQLIDLMSVVTFGEVKIKKEKKRGKKKEGTKKVGRH